jgi:glycosyltransferase involved in cell wall biosynthesis
LEEQKGFSYLLEAFSIIRKRIRTHLIILGDGSQREFLEKKIKILKITNDIWMPGFIRNPYAYMVQSKLFVLSSIYEGFGNVLTESLALNIPIISTSCPSGPKEILKEGKYGRLVPYGDPEALAEAMLKSLSGDHPVFDKNEALERFQTDLVVTQYLEALGFATHKHQRIDTRSEKYNF